jgi:hypothetical protein
MANIQPNTNKTGNVRTYNLTLSSIRATTVGVEINKYYMF